MQQLHFRCFTSIIRLNVGTVVISHIEKESDTHLYWPDLDVDLTIDMIVNPEAYPLRYK